MSALSSVGGRFRRDQTNTVDVRRIVLAVDAADGVATATLRSASSVMTSNGYKSDVFREGDDMEGPRIGWIGRASLRAGIRTRDKLAC